MLGDDITVVTQEAGTQLETWTAVAGVGLGPQIMHSDTPFTGCLPSSEVLLGYALGIGAATPRFRLRSPTRRR